MFGLKRLKYRNLVETNLSYLINFNEAYFQRLYRSFDGINGVIDDAFKAGRPITGAQADDVSRGVITKAGYADEFLHRTGHSIGEEGHGNGANIDNLETRDSRRLIPRTAFSIEPGIYLAGKFGVRSEIDVYLTGTDAIITHPHQTEIFAIMK